MAAITKYASDIDGKEFNSEAEQKAYDMGLAHKAKIDSFVDRHYPQVKGRKAGPSRSIVGKAIAAWLADEMTQSPSLMS